MAPAPLTRSRHGKVNLFFKGHARRFTETSPVSPEQVHRPARLTVMLAITHRIHQAIDRGVVQDRAEVARRLGLTRARITQLIDLTLLAPDIQERILFAEVVDGLEPMSERHLREEGSHRRSVSTPARRLARQHPPDRPVQPNGILLYGDC